MKTPPRAGLPVLACFFLLSLGLPIPLARSQDSPAGAGTKTVAIVNGHKITEAALQREIDRQPALAMLFKEAENNVDRTDQARRRALEALIDRLLLVKAAQQSDTSNEEEVGDFVEQVIESYGGRKRLAALLKGINSDLPSFLQQISDDKRIEMFLAHEAGSGLKVEEQEIRAEFEQHKSRYKAKEEVKLAHILIPLRAKPDKQATEEARRKIEEVHELASDPRSDFSQLAAKFSHGPSAAKGGLLGSFVRGALPPELEQAAFKMRAGEISKPLHTRYGFQILKVLEHDPERQQDLDEVRENIRALLITRKKNAAKKDLIARLRSKAKIRVL